MSSTYGQGLSGKMPNERNHAYHAALPSLGRRANDQCIKVVKIDLLNVSNRSDWSSRVVWGIGQNLPSIKALFHVLDRALQLIWCDAAQGGVRDAASAPRTNQIAEVGIFDGRKGSICLCLLRNCLVLSSILRNRKLYSGRWQQQRDIHYLHEVVYGIIVIISDRESKVQNVEYRVLGA